MAANVDGAQDISFVVREILVTYVEQLIGETEDPQRLMGKQR